MPDLTCPQCGQPLPTAGRFCSHCGAVYVRPPSHVPPPAPLAAVVAAPVPASALAATVTDEPSPLSTLVDPGPPSSVLRSQATMFGFAAPASLRAPPSTGPTSASQPPPSVSPPSAPLVPDQGAAVVAIPAAPRPAFNRTMLGIPSAAPAPAPTPAPTPTSAPIPAPIAPAKPSALGSTMLMMDAPAPPSTTAPGQPAPQAQPAQPAQLPTHSNLASNKGTMMGVAVPGIAPLSASAAPAGIPARKGGSSTMLGVALPGIAPLHSSDPPAAGYPAPYASGAPGAYGGSLKPGVVSAPTPIPPVLPRPAPLVDDEPRLGPAPRLKKGGVPVAYVAGGVFAFVVVIGLLVALLWKGQSLVVVPRLDSQGRDQLHLTCDSCTDGTTASLDAAHATFEKKEANLTLATPLSVGDNALTIHLDRPGMGRDEDVNVVVPVAFRIRADLSALAGAHPSVLVRVTAVAGTVVQVDGKPLALDPKGEGAYTLDVGSQTTGWSDEIRLIDQSIPYAITTPPEGAAEDKKPQAQRGTLAVRAGIATLHLDGPSPTAVTEASSIRLFGHTVKGGSVTVNGQVIPVEPSGAFSRSIDVTKQGDNPIDMRADGPQLASRSAHFIVRRVPHLADEAKLRERLPSLGFDAMMADTAGNVQKDVIIEGEVLQSKTTGSQTLALIDDTRGCARGASCLVRVVSPGLDDPTALDHGTHVRVYGKLTGVVTPSAGGGGGGGGSSGTVPVVQADFVLKGPFKP